MNDRVPVSPAGARSLNFLAMPSPVKVLPQELTLKIAAGEVIERPASIVKELLENALDAGATHVTITLEKGGLELIRVTDNGCGMTREDAALAFERFATSKIRRFEDLYTVSSFGFRGEALPSIAAVSTVELVTRTKDAVAGTRVLAEEGAVKAVSEIGCPVGTSVTVRRVFASLPVRRKFLKSEKVEQGLCLERIQRTALSSLGVRLEVSGEGRELLSLPAATRLDERISLLLGRGTREELTPVSGEKDGIRLQGFVSRPGSSRSSARHIYLYVNGRFVRDGVVQGALMAAYRNVMEARRYPVAVLFVHCPPGTVDVNVHPTKSEVRFRDPRLVYALVLESVSLALTGLFPFADGEEPRGDLKDDPTEGVREAVRRYHLLRNYGKKIPGDRPESPRWEMEGDGGQSPLPSGTASVGVLDLQDKRPVSSFAYLGQVGGTYLVFSGPEGLVLVDQHAAHERLLFERLKKAWGGDRKAQGLVVPLALTLTPGEARTVWDLRDDLAGVGLEVDRLGRDTILVRSVPAALPDLDVEGFVKDLLDDAARGESPPRLEGRRDGLLRSLACRGAVKARQALSPEEALALCLSLEQDGAPASCPHGRPLYREIPLREIEKMFKRR